MKRQPELRRDWEISEAGRTIMLITHESDVAAEAQRTVRIRDGLVEELTGVA